MIYTSGIVRDLTVEESLEQLQDNKLTAVCEKVSPLPLVPFHPLPHHVLPTYLFSTCGRSLT